MQIKHEFDKFWSETLEMSQKLEIGEPELKRRGWKPRRLIEIDSSDDETDNENVPESVKNHYKKIYLESYGLVCECLTNRFEQEGLKNENLQEVLVLAAGKKNYDEKRFLTFKHMILNQII